MYTYGLECFLSLKLQILYTGEKLMFHSTFDRRHLSSFPPVQFHPAKSLDVEEHKKLGTKTRGFSASLSTFLFFFLSAYVLLCMRVQCVPSIVFSLTYKEASDYIRRCCRHYRVDVIEIPSRRFVRRLLENLSLSLFSFDYLIVYIEKKKRMWVT